MAEKQDTAVNHFEDIPLDEQISFYVKHHFAKKRKHATTNEIFHALSHAIRNMMTDNWEKTQKKYEAENRKAVNYLSIEYLMGRLLGNNLINIGMYDEFKKLLDKNNLDLNSLIEEENDMSLGNGGLGRLAACFLDSLATMNYPAYAYGLRYEFGIFRQRIINGYQMEEPYSWMLYGNPWEVIRPEATYRVRLFGESNPYKKENGDLAFSWENTEDVYAIAYDIPIPGFRNDTVNTLRLWEAKSSPDFHFINFHEGHYYKAIQSKNYSEMISKVLYPNDNAESGRELRLKQQYFFVSATIQDIVARFKKNNKDFLDFPVKNAIQLNDTHPALAIPELMRILIDQEELSWEEAWDISYRTFSYTNHTILSEAMEKWPVHLFKSMLPRHLQIIYEINHRFLDNIRQYFTKDESIIRNMSIFKEDGIKSIRMANLSVLGSHKVNGVAELHTDILKERVFNDLNDYDPYKFISITNGITHRRWLLKANPPLSELITETIGDKWMTDLSEIKKLEDFTADKSFRERFSSAKLTNKKKLADFIKRKNNITVNPDSIFDVQVKRIHEYKRQLLNVLHIVQHYNRLKNNPNKSFVPRTFIFAGKAAPGYHIAKKIIKLINSVAYVINSDKNVQDKLKVVFLDDYSVSLAEKIIPAADLSEQISTAGFEASGTGNMKMMLNGAVTIGTLDGANIEILEQVGQDNIFIFGMTADEIVRLKNSGYNPYTYYERNLDLKKVLDMIKHNYFSKAEPGIFNNLIDDLVYRKDDFCLLADFDTYAARQDEVNSVYKNQDEWIKMAILNTARSGYFSSDRSIKTYAKEIWDID